MRLGLELEEKVQTFSGLTVFPREYFDPKDSETYELKLPSDSTFAQVHGDVKLLYTVYIKEQTIMLNTITPSDILLEGHKSELTTYKGIMISKANASKDMFKIDLLKALQENK